VTFVLRSSFNKLGKTVKKLVLILTLAILPFAAFSAHHKDGEGAKEHAGKDAKSKEHGGKAAKSKEHGGKAAKSKEHGGKAAKSKEHGGKAAKSKED